MADFGSDRQAEARLAYGNHEKSVEIHGHKMETFNVDIRKNGAMKNRASVISSLLGLGASAITLGAMGASSRTSETVAKPEHALKVLLWAACGGACIAYNITTGFAAERFIYDLELRRELWEIENHMTGELQEMICIYKGLGLSEDEAHVVTHIFAKQKRLFANLMMVEELGYSRLEPPTWREALTNAGVPSVVGFLAGATGPLLPLMWGAAKLVTRTDGEGSVGGTQVNGRIDLSGTKGHALGCVLLGVGSCCVSFAESEVFFGAYSNTKLMVKHAALNVAGIAAIYTLSFAISRFA